MASAEKGKEERCLFSGVKNRTPKEGPSPPSAHLLHRRTSVIASAEGGKKRRLTPDISPFFPYIQKGLFPGRRNDFFTGGETFVGARNRKFPPPLKGEETLLGIYPLFGTLLLWLGTNWGNFWIVRFLSCRFPIPLMTAIIYPRRQFLLLRATIFKRERLARFFSPKKDETLVLYSFFCFIQVSLSAAKKAKKGTKRRKKREERRTHPSKTFLTLLTDRFKFHHQTLRLHYS